MDLVRFTIKVLNMGTEVACIEGEPTTAKSINVKDLHDVVALEQQLERLTGYRFHIHMEYKSRNPAANGAA